MQPARCEAVTNATCKVRPLIHLPDFRGQANETSIKMCGTMRQDRGDKSTVRGATKPMRVKQHREKGHLALEVGSDEVCEAFQSRPGGWVYFPFEVEEIFAWDAGTEQRVRWRNLLLLSLKIHSLNGID
jgi:hypothetical protein